MLCLVSFGVKGEGIVLKIDIASHQHRIITKKKNIQQEEEAKKKKFVKNFTNHHLIYI